MPQIQTPKGSHRFYSKNSNTEAHYAACRLLFRFNSQPCPLPFEASGQRKCRTNNNMTSSKPDFLLHATNQNPICCVPFLRELRHHFFSKARVKRFYLFETGPKSGRRGGQRWALTDKANIEPLLQICFQGLWRKRTSRFIIVNGVTCITISVASTLAHAQPTFGSAFSSLFCSHTPPKLINRGLACATRPNRDNGMAVRGRDCFRMTAWPTISSEKRHLPSICRHHQREVTGKQGRSPLLC